MIKFIFDVDGTLTPSRGLMDKKFGEWFRDFAAANDVYIVTGSDRTKTLEQIPLEIYNEFNRAYHCSGNDVWVKSNNIRSGSLTLPQGLLLELDKILNKSKFYVKTGKHIDYRPGLVNFSIVGRGCSLQERVMYREWDEHKNERQSISNKLSKLFPHLNFQIAGETGIDITAKGNDKSQILRDFKDTDVIYFFGDKCQEGGNDHEIALAVNDRENGSRVYEVEDWEHTWLKISSLG